MTPIKASKPYSVSRNIKKLIVSFIVYYLTVDFYIFIELCKDTYKFLQKNINGKIM